MRRGMAPFAQKVREGSHAPATKVFHRLWGSGEAWDDIPEMQRRYIVDRIEHVLASDELIWEDGPSVLKEGRIEALEMLVTLVESENSPEIITKIVDALCARGCRRDHRARGGPHGAADQSDAGARGGAG